MRTKWLLVLLIFVFTSSAFAQRVEQEEKAAFDIEKDRKLMEKLETPRKKGEIEKPPLPETPLPPEGKKILVSEINVTGATLFSRQSINRITAPYLNQQVSIRQMQEMANQITDLYRKKGYITSRAYLPPQKIEKGIVEIRVIEGSTGEITIKGNRFFRAVLLRNKIDLEKGEPFDYELLRKGLSRINQQPDRYAKAVLSPGKEPGTTDVLVEVKDKLPIHVGFDWDTFGSQYIGKQRYRTTVTDYNLLGHDDVLTLQYQLSQRQDYELISGRYVFPLREDLKLGFFGAHSHISLGKEFRALNARGKSKLYSAYTIHNLIDTENIDLNVNLGFDYKDIFNFQLGNEISRDRLRVAKASVDFDMTDAFGRTIITNEWAFGIPNIMGGLHPNDSRASRIGSGGEFYKDTMNILRLQKMPFGSTLLWKNQLQMTTSILPAAEQFQIGGITNVRGYPPAEVVGDNGYSMTWELSLPVYFIPRRIGVPFSKAKLYDAVRFVGFYDWANVGLRNPMPGEESHKTLRSGGCGFRFNLPEDFSARAEVAWPLDNLPSDGKNVRTWFEVSKSF